MSTNAKPDEIAVFVRYIFPNIWDHNGKNITQFDNAFYLQTKHVVNLKNNIFMQTEDKVHPKNDVSQPK